MRVWMVAFEHCELLPQGENLEGVITPTSNEHGEARQGRRTIDSTTAQTYDF
jgi:hypothetical protein